MELLEVRGERLNELATMLSRKLELAEHWLQCLPGKITAVVECEGDPPAQLQFARFGESWLLFYCQKNQEPAPVTRASVPIKARAAKALPALLEQLGQNLIDAATACDAGCKLLEGFNFEGGK